MWTTLTQAHLVFAEKSQRENASSEHCIFHGTVVHDHALASTNMAVLFPFSVYLSLSGKSFNKWCCSVKSRVAAVVVLMEEKGDKRQCCPGSPLHTTPPSKDKRL
ncbi:hypothetical protein Nepgr_027956 [Nepenthes gracilis]|uniref:Uncharacterized protein n=1 Tax=Nepenthes gracilis TaxID=150966 RepID=A0AAD3Y1Y5_NEPGR|nr:hypothetical protein Nepgr_027956 [Nepenthes gracilis]